MQNIISKCRLFQSLTFSSLRYKADVHITQKPFINMTSKDFLDFPMIRHVLKSNLPNKTKRSQHGIYHGKQIKSGHHITFSEKKTDRTWRPNVFVRNVYSDILKRKMRIELTSKTIKCIRKYGGFDNYILLTKPQKMDSLYGEYIRSLIMNKLNNPEFKVPYIVKSKPYDINLTRKDLRFNQKPRVFIPKDIRYTDLSQLAIKTPAEMSKKELERFKAMNKLAKTQVDILTSNPYLREEDAIITEEMNKLEPLRQEILEKLKKKTSKKQMEMVRAIVKEDKQEGFLLK